MCTRQSRQVIWDMINTLFLTTVAVEPTFVAFLQHSQTYVRGLPCHSFKFLWRTVNSKPPTIPLGIVACTFSNNLSRNRCIRLHLPWVNLHANEQKCKQWRHDECGGKKLKHQKVTYEKTVNSNSYCINYACSIVSVFRLQTISNFAWQDVTTRPHEYSLKH